MLKSIYLHNFKSFAEAELPLEQLTLMIGSNASGKSNALEALWILSQLATGRELSVILDGERRSDGRVRGGSAACPRVPFQSFELGCTYQAAEYALEYRITIRVDDGVVVERESLKRSTEDKGKMLFETENNNTSSDYLMVWYLSDQSNDYPFRTICDRNKAVLSQIYMQILSDNGSTSKVSTDVHIFQLALSHIFVFQPEPWRMRDYARMGDKELRFNGENLSAVLHDLRETKNGIEDIRKIIDDLPDNGIEKMGFILTTARDVMLSLQEAGGVKIDARQLSDGTLRCLAILAAVYSEPEGSMIVVEELDNGIHPSRIAKLLHAVQQIAAERHLLLVVTTHNPAVMDAVDPNHMDGLVLCYRSKEDGASTFARIVDLPDYLRLVAKGSTGELAEQDAFVQSIYHPRERGKMSYTWLKEDVL